MVSHRTLYVGLATLLPLTSCQDPAGPCDRPNACEVPGVDLLISELELVAEQFDSVDGLGVVRADTVEIRSVVRNRGDSTSEATTLVLRYTHAGNPAAPLAGEDSVQIPPLRPGESHLERTRLATWPAAWGYLLAATNADTVSVAAKLVITDADSTNNEVVSARAHVAIALLEVTLAPADTDLWVGEPVAARLTIANRSRHGHFAPTAIGFSLRTLPPLRDRAGLTTFGMHDVPAVAPSSQYEEDLVLTFPSRAAWQYVAHDYVVHPVLAAAGTGDTVPIGLPWLPGVATITLHPDYRACEPVLLVPDTLVWAPHVCDVPGPMYVFELQVRADHTYGIEQPDPDSPGATIYTANGLVWGDAYEGMDLQFTEPGTYWVVDHVWRKYDIPPARSMRLREWATESSGNEEVTNEYASTAHASDRRTERCWLRGSYSAHRTLVQRRLGTTQHKR